MKLKPRTLRKSYIGELKTNLLKKIEKQVQNLNEDKPNKLST